MYLHEIKAPLGARQRKKIVGRGPGSGHGKTAGRGTKGQGSRSGDYAAKASEGGQMRLLLRLPKVGFRPHRPNVYQVVNIENLDRFAKNDIVNAESLKEKNLISSLNKPVKILGTGNIKKSLTIQVNSVSKAAKEKIEKAGGKIEAVLKEVSNKENN